MHKIELEFKRIQTYLFASPRLRAMLGANATLGRAIRMDLPLLAQGSGAKADPTLIQHLPAADPADPLCRQPSDLHATLMDDPARIYQEYGVLVRDGGHFIATFPTREQAHGFIHQAHAYIAKILPGILLEAQCDGQKVLPPNIGECLFQHPAFQVSQHLGNRPAESRNAKGAFVSVEERVLEEQGKQFRQQPGDLIGLLEQHRLIPCPDMPPESLSDLTQGDYLAVIHADGNSIGQRYTHWQETAPASVTGLAREAYGERFFHSMRVAVRRALATALTTIFADAPKRYQLLMLGGDDLLLVCAASYALPFVHAYAQALQDIPLSDKKPISIGAGIAIAKETFPFHRLHAMAETLADSAKQRFRADASQGSVADWHITTATWVDDPIAERRADSLTATLALSGKPYPILGPASLGALLEASEKLVEPAATMARSQLHALRETLRQGPFLGKLAWCELPQGMGALLENALSAFPQDDLLQSKEGLTRNVLADLVELIEINRKRQSAQEHTT